MFLCIQKGKVMNSTAKERLATLIKERVDLAGGQRAYCRKIGVAQITLAGWLRAQTVPSLDNFLLVADEAGFNCEELISYLGIAQSPVKTDSDQVLKQMRLLPRDSLAQVVEAGVRMLVTG
jgi:transcriptional regulator with XRE-family HTH domain